ncbi:MAG: RNA polymerase sigma-54 factor [Deltaproteobacteria bacterium]|nr:MAG: RNA polymerase sigma-54 factor [Deltaproteobacteria bacterium]RLC16886.1 MAG: RNA polymerase sigma-54 factor [Deltaproteobacteria bacterium]
MAIELRQQLKLTQQLIMTPQLQMAIKLLQLSRLELVEKIQQELEENPALDEVQETLSPEPTAEKTEVDSEVSEQTKEVTFEDKINEDIDWRNYIEEYNSPGRMPMETEGRESPRFDSFISKKESLSDHLLWQFLMTSPDSDSENIGSLIIGNLTKDGYLDVSLDEITETSGRPREMVEQVLALLQTFDPIGVCARDISECLLIQIKHLGLGDNSILNDIVENHLHHLENNNYRAICKALKVRMDDVIAAVNVIKGLEPKPGREFSESDVQYITPDIYVYKSENDFVIVLNDDGLPKLQVNSYYKKAMVRGDKISAETKEYLQDKLRSAAWLIRSIHQRQKTIYKAMESILKFQRSFFEKGITHLKPMVLRDVAEDIEMHESTISRVTTNKYAYTPQGIFELKYFFNSSIKRIHGEAIASASVQAKIKKIIEGENPKKPFSDSKMAEMLKDQNVDIARRTVAKYREVLGVLSSNKRKQF